MDGLLDEEWLHYSYVGHAETWKVVLLSLNINPKFAELEKDHFAYFRETTIKKISVNRRMYCGGVTDLQINERYEVIENRKYDGKYSVGNHEVNIQRFVEFAEKLNLKPFPEKLLNLFQKADNSTTNSEEAAKLYPETRWSINYPNRDKGGYSRSLIQALEHFLNAGSPPPTAKMVTEYWHSVKPHGISVDFSKKEFTYPLQEGDKIASFKNLKDAMRGRINK